MAGARVLGAQDTIPRWAPAVPPWPVRGPGLTPFAYTTPDGTRDTADAGTVRVPVHHGRAGRDSLTLVFVRLRSKAARPAAPVVHLAGGPGASAIDLARGQQMRLFEDLRQVGDVILLDQRGTGRSEPDTRCAGTWRLPAERSVDHPAAARAFVGPARACAARLRARGVDLTAFNSVEIADDVESLRATLGVPRVSLYGFSSGSHFALEAARRHPGAVERVVIGGVEGPGQTYKRPSNAVGALARLDSAVRADPRMRHAVPDLPAAMDAVHRRLRDAPVTVRLPLRTVLRRDGRGFWARRAIDLVALVRPRYAVRVSAFDLQAMLAVGLGRADLVAEIPALYAQMARGDFARAALLALYVRRGLPVGTAMGWAVDCADGVSPARADSIARDTTTLLGRAANWPYPAVCAGWGDVGDAGDAARRPARVETPVLLAVGSLDGRTSLEQAREVLGHLPNGHLIRVDGAAHSDVAIFNAPEVRSTVLRFLAGEPFEGTRAPARVTLPPPAFVPPAPAAASLADTLVAAGVGGGAAALVARYEALRAAHAADYAFDFREPTLNDAGYRLLRAGRVDAAVAAFRLNAAHFPRSLNAHDSLGEALLVAGRHAEAAAALRRAVSLGFNPHSYVLLWRAERGEVVPGR